MSKVLEGTKARTDLSKLLDEMEAEMGFVSDKLLEKLVKLDRLRPVLVRCWRTPTA